jgi:hypothetical protein
MLCPMKFSLWQRSRQGVEPPAGASCEGEICAWWIKKAAQCAITVIGVELYGGLKTYEQNLEDS